MRQATTLKATLAAALCLAILPASGAGAQTAELAGDLARAERGLVKLDEALRGMLIPAQSGGFNAQMEVRITQLEGTISQLRGQIEQLQFQMQSLQNDVDRSLADIEYRIDLLEGGDGSSSSLSTPSTGGSASSGSSGSAAGSSSSTVQPLGTLPGGSGASSGSAFSGSGAGSAEAQYQNAYAMLQGRDYTGAESAFRSFITANPGHPLASNAQYWLGEAYMAQGLTQQAVDAFAVGYQNYPNGNKTMDSLLRLGEALVQAGRYQDACFAFRQFQVQFTNAPAQLRQRAQQSAQQIGCG